MHDIIEPRAATHRARTRDIARRELQSAATIDELPESENSD